MDPNIFLDWLQTRRSIRDFSEEAVDRDTLLRLITAATTAPSNSNRQPWRFAVITNAEIKRQIVTAISAQVALIKSVIARGHHANSFVNYGDFFHEPLAAAPVLIFPQYRTHTDLIANLIASGGGDPDDFLTASAMQAELCSTSAAIMALLLQTLAEGLGACWMAGPTIARPAIHHILGIQPPWCIVGGIALGYPAETPSPQPRKPLDRVIQWFE